MQIPEQPLDQPDQAQLLKLLSDLYGKKGKARDFDGEKRVFNDLLPLLIDHLRGASYSLTEPIGLGSTATVWVVKDRRLHQDRALKLPRPRLGKLRNIISIARAEPVRLAALNHQNVIKVYFAGDVKLAIDGDDYSFPYFIMDLLQGVKDLDDYILSNRKSLQAEEAISYLRDVLNGLAFLHQQSIVHCDIKPGNILISPDQPALIADLGYAKHLPRLFQEDPKLTHVTYTPRYAHPELSQRMIESSDSNANVAAIPQDQLRPAFDLFAFGRSVQDVLSKLREAEASDPEPQSSGARRSIFTRYQWLYLGSIAKRLLDGRVVDPGIDELTSDVIPGLPDTTMAELRYGSAGEALEDFEKLLHLYNLEGEIPELNPNLPSYIQIPHCKVPLTPRVDAVISHPTFRHLAQVTQLGFVSLIYPGATHTRFEHILGTFAHCCDYIRALWYDQANCLFQSIMTQKDIELGLLAALVHDLGQYPMAHDLTETASEFAHERFTRSLLEKVQPDVDFTLAHVIRSEWDIDIEDLGKVIYANENSSFKYRLLHSIIDGPIDCDKLDYLRRDSTHLGVSFGLAIDHERLTRNLTIVYDSVREATVGPSGHRYPVLRLRVAEIGVTEKALAVAHALAKSRADMFRQVYWHHTVRALKAMLGYVVRSVMIRLSSSDDPERFWKEFHDCVFGGIHPLHMATRGEEGSEGSRTSVDDWLPEFSERVGEFTNASGLVATDDMILAFLWRFASEAERKMIHSIRTRNVYRRLAVMSGALDSDHYKDFYVPFWTYRLRGQLKEVENSRQEWEERIIEEVEDRTRTNRNLLPAGFDTDALLEALRKVQPLILVDIPLKAVSGGHKQEFLYYLPEDYFGVHSRDSQAFPRFARAEINLEQEAFDKEVGKIRVLVAPEWRELIVRCLPEKDVLALLK